jgi:hypothetical protein
MASDPSEIRTLPTHDLEAGQPIRPAALRLSESRGEPNRPAAVKPVVVTPVVVKPASTTQTEK